MKKPCKHLEFTASPAGRYLNKPRRCLAPAPELPKLPRCLTKTNSFSWPPIRGLVWKEECEECPCWEPRE